MNDIIDDEEKKRLEKSTRARKVLDEAAGPNDPTWTPPGPPSETPPGDEPSWWQQYRNQIYVGLIVGLIVAVPSLILTLLG